MFDFRWLKIRADRAKALRRVRSLEQKLARCEAAKMQPIPDTMLISRITGINEELVETRKQLDNAKKATEAARGQAIRLEHLVKLEQRVPALENTIAKQRLQIVNSEAAIEKLKRELRVSENVTGEDGRLAQMRKNCEQQIQDIQNRVAREIRQASEAVQETMKTLDSAKDKNEMLTRENNQRQVTINNLQTKLLDSEAASKTNAAEKLLWQERAIQCGWVDPEKVAAEREEKIAKTLEMYPGWDRERAARAVDDGTRFHHLELD